MISKLMKEHKYHSVNGHVEHPSGPHNGEDSVNVLKDKDHHFLLILGGRS